MNFRREHIASVLHELGYGEELFLGDIGLDVLIEGIHAVPAIIAEHPEFVVDVQVRYRGGKTETSFVSYISVAVAVGSIQGI